MLKFVFAIVGWVISVVVGLGMSIGAVMSLMRHPEAVKGFTQEFGYPEYAMVPLGIVSICAVLLYLLPPTKVFGGILLTGYLGGAVATHVHHKEGIEGFAPAIIAGVLVWLGLYFRDNRVRDLMPWPNPTGPEPKTK